MAVQVIHPQLKEEIFGAKVRLHLLHQTVVMQLNNRRAGTASTKSKGFVSGGGKKPWRQKGTGRARAGSIRSPLWVGGGTTFGPQPRDYSYRLPKKARKQALLSALSAKNGDGKIIVLDKWELAEPKTKLMRKVLDDLKVTSALIVIPQSDERVERSARNLPAVKVLRVEGLNVYDLLRHEHLILTEGSLRLIEERLAPIPEEVGIKASEGATR
jgi:large subunit ribosomal protein L4